MFPAQCLVQCSECPRLIQPGDKTVKWKNAPYWAQWAHAHHIDEDLDSFF